MNDIMRLNKSKTLADTIANFPHFFDCTMVHTCNNQPWLPVRRAPPTLGLV